MCQDLLLYLLLIILICVLLVLTEDKEILAHSNKYLTANGAVFCHTLLQHECISYGKEMCSAGTLPNSCR